MRVGCPLLEDGHLQIARGAWLRQTLHARRACRARIDRALEARRAIAAQVDLCAAATEAFASRTDRVARVVGNLEIVIVEYGLVPSYLLRHMTCGLLGKMLFVACVSWVTHTRSPSRWVSYRQ